MSELIKKQVTDARALMEKAIDHCEGELQKIRAGKASPSMLDDIGLDAALEWHCREFAVLNGVSCYFESEYVETDLSLEIQTEIIIRPAIH